MWAMCCLMQVSFVWKLYQYNTESTGLELPNLTWNEDILEVESDLSVTTLLEKT